MAVLDETVGTVGEVEGGAEETQTGQLHVVGVDVDRNRPVFRLESHPVRPATVGRPEVEDQSFAIKTPLTWGIKELELAEKAVSRRQITTGPGPIFPLLPRGEAAEVRSVPKGAPP